MFGQQLKKRRNNSVSEYTSIKPVAKSSGLWTFHRKISYCLIRVFIAISAADNKLIIINHGFYQAYHQFKCCAIQRLKTVQRWHTQQQELSCLKIKGFVRTRIFSHKFSNQLLQIVFRWGDAGCRSYIQNTKLVSLVVLTPRCYA